MMNAEAESSGRTISETSRAPTCSAAFLAIASALIRDPLPFDPFVRLISIGYRDQGRRRARRQSGVDDFRFHDTRHTIGTRVLRKTGNLKIAQQLLGHTNISTTAKYAHAAIDDVREAMEQVAKSRKKARKGWRRTG